MNLCERASIFAIVWELIRFAQVPPTCVFESRNIIASDFNNFLRSSTSLAT